MTTSARRNRSSVLVWLTFNFNRRKVSLCLLVGLCIRNGWLWKRLKHALLSRIQACYLYHFTKGSVRNRQFNGLSGVLDLRAENPKLFHQKGWQHKNGIQLNIVIFRLWKANGNGNINDQINIREWLLWRISAEIGLSHPRHFQINSAPLSETFGLLVEQSFSTCRGVINNYGLWSISLQ